MTLTPTQALIAAATECETSADACLARGGANATSCAIMLRGAATRIRDLASNIHTTPPSNSGDVTSQIERLKLAMLEAADWELTHSQAHVLAHAVAAQAAAAVPTEALRDKAMAALMPLVDCRRVVSVCTKGPTTYHIEVFVTEVERASKVRGDLAALDFATTQAPAPAPDCVQVEVTAEAMHDRLSLAIDLIQEAKGGAGDEGFVVSHLDAAEGHIDFVAEALAQTTPPVSTPLTIERLQAILEAEDVWVSGSRAERIIAALAQAPKLYADERQCDDCGALYIGKGCSCEVEP